MANVLTEVFPKILAMALPVLRENAIMARVVAREPYQAESANRGDSIVVPITAPLAAVEVAPANYAPNPADIAPTSVTVPLDQWYEVPFQLSDKDMNAIDNGFLPVQAQEAVKALVTKIDQYLITQFLAGVPYSVGTVDTTPFGTDLSEFLDARAQLNKKLAPLSPRFAVLDPVAEANALNLRAFQDASFRGDAQGITEGVIGRKLGADWLMDQNIADRTSGTANGAWQFVGAQVAGARQIPIDTGTGTWLPGDVFTVAGDAEPYAVTAYSGGILTISPGLRVGIADNAVLTPVSSSGTANLYFHRDCLAFANRGFIGDAMARAAGAIFDSITDPVSGLTIRLEMVREHKRVRWSFDALWGGKVVRPELGVRIYG